MRARNIKPGFFTNEVLAAMSEKTRLLFAGLWCCADRDGLLEDRPERIRAEVFPYDHKRIDTNLSELNEAGFIKRYVSEGVAVIEVVQFLSHQRPHHTEKKSKLVKQRLTGELTLTNGEPTVNSREVHGELTVNSPWTHGEYPSDSLIHGFTDSLILRSTDSPNHENSAGEPHDMDLPHEGDDTPPEPYSDDFLAFWDVFPQGRRKSKGAAWKSWQKSIKRTKPKVIIEAAREYATSDEGRGQFVKMPSTWLNNECWLDDRVAWGNSPSQRTLAYTPEGMAKANDQDL